MTRTTAIGLGINQKGLLEFWVGQGNEVDYLQAEVPLMAHMWYFVAATLDAKTGRATLYQEGVGNRYNSFLGKVVPYRLPLACLGGLPVPPEESAGDAVPDRGLARLAREARSFRFAIVSAARSIGCGIVRSRIEPRGARRDQERPSADITWAGRLLGHDRGLYRSGHWRHRPDIGPFHLHAKGYNRPVRAQTGWNWNGRNDCFRLAPQEYGGIEFHADAMIDCNWKVTNSLKLPESCEAACTPCACAPVTARAWARNTRLLCSAEGADRRVSPFSCRRRAISPMPTSI